MHTERTIGSILAHSSAPANSSKCVIKALIVPTSTTAACACGQDEIAEKNALQFSDKKLPSSFLSSFVGPIHKIPLVGENLLSALLHFRLFLHIDFVLSCPSALKSFFCDVCFFFLILCHLFYSNLLETFFSLLCQFSLSAPATASRASFDSCKNSNPSQLLAFLKIFATE